MDFNSFFQTIQSSNMVSLQTPKQANVLIKVSSNMNLLLNGTQDGDSGLIILAIDAVGGYSLTLGAQFSTAKNMGGQALALTANSYNCMSWWNIGGIVYYRNI